MMRPNDDRRCDRRSVQLVPLVASLAAALPAWLTLIGLLAATPAAAQLSPGELSAAHAELEGVSGCLDCHAPGQGVAAQRCLACHGALRRRIAAGEGLHAGPTMQRCETCHIEHHGREFELIFWGEQGRGAFDHRRTAWPLTGAHASTACRDCHRPANLVDPAALTEGGADPVTTFLGLATACAGCHRDPHRGQLSGERRGASSCSDCHATSAWRPAPGFDHAATGFPLAGAHARAACIGCHPPLADGAGAGAEGSDPAAASGGIASLRLTGISHASCADCHADPHRGRLGASCAQCHSPTAWSRVDRSAFDHSRTRFPLTGLHRSVACADCHGTAPGGGGQGSGSTGSGLATRRPRFASCADCHSDPHRGRLGGSCAGCHDTGGFKAGAGDFDHDRTRFPLAGEHRQLACADCHRGGRIAGVTLPFATCDACHADPHRGQLRPRIVDGESGGGACADCHTVAGFVPSTFTAADHRATSFPLDGAHLAVACVDCHRLTDPEAIPDLAPRSGGLPLQRSHRPSRLAAEDPVRRFRFANTGCEACHLDPHAGAPDEAGNRPLASLGLACADCHQTDSFHRVGERAAELTAGAFDHAAVSGFPLAGGHRDVGCRECHLPGEMDRAVRFAGAPDSCGGCHRDPHFGTELPAAGETAQVRCADCHQVASWRRVAFDHGRDTGFPLDGAHRRVQCAACHRRGGEPLIAPPTACEACHGQATGDPAFILPSSWDR